MNDATTNKEKIMDVASDLKGRAVLKSDTGEKLGQVEDVIINPTNGWVVGIALRSVEGATISLSAQDYVIGRDAVMVRPGTLKPTTLAGDTLAGGVNSSAIVGANVVTEDGKLLGRVSEVHVSEDRSVAIYHVVESTLQRFFGGGFFLAGDVPQAYSQEGRRLIVPANTEDMHARSSLAEASELPAGRMPSASGA
ncbi:MAG: PRC-barrel domain-containing protein [Acidobacteriota bacterium]